jgi:hypothetical protein
MFKKTGGGFRVISNACFFASFYKILIKSMVFKNNAFAWVVC